MADIFLIRTKNPQARAKACLEVKKLLIQYTPESIVEVLEGPDWSLMTGRNPFVPYASSSDAQGAAVVLGSTLDTQAPTVADLRRPGQRDPAFSALCQRLNYGVALGIEQGEILVTTDFLGLYPLFYYQDDSTLIISSLASAFRCYEGFRAQLDELGLAGIFLFSHGVLGHTLFKGVHRLGSRQVLRISQDARLTVATLPFESGGESPKNVAEAVEAFDAQLDKAVAGAVRQKVHSVMLSGGLDSRILSGYLRRLSDQELSALTFGDPADYEMIGAARVAAEIRARHEGLPVPLDELPNYAQQALNTDPLASGLYLISYWAIANQPRPPMLTGYFGDTIMGAVHTPWGLESAGPLHTFHAMFEKINFWGLSPGVIGELMRAKDINDIVQNVYRRLREEYYSFPGEPWHKSWWFEQNQRQRMLVGRLLKIIAQRSWPVLPYVYPELIRLAYKTPYPVLAERKTQYELIRRKFESLARLPLAGNVDRVWLDIIPRKSNLLTRVVDRGVESVAWHLRNRKGRPDRRYVVRVLDYNASGWKVLRDQARSQAGAVDEWLNASVVDLLIRPGSEFQKHKFPISETTGRRTLIGALLACHKYLAGR